MLFGEPFGGLIPGARGAVLGVLLRTGTPLTGRQLRGLIRDENSLWTVQPLRTLHGSMPRIKQRGVMGAAR